MVVLAKADEPQIQSQAAQPVQVFQLVTRGDPPGGDDVRAVPAVTEERRGSAVQARNRPVPRNRADVVEPVRSDVRRRHQETEGEPDEGLSPLALACR